MNWFERHLNWTLLLGVIGGPFVFFWISFALLNLINYFAPKLADVIGVPIISSEPIIFILIIISVVAWYSGKRRQKRDQL